LDFILSYSYRVHGLFATAKYCKSNETIEFTTSYCNELLGNKPLRKAERGEFVREIELPWSAGQMPLL
jgi:hypothetical protein